MKGWQQRWVYMKMLEWNQWGERQERRHGKGNTKLRNRSDNEYLHDENVFSKIHQAIKKMNDWLTTYPYFILLGIQISHCIIYETKYNLPENLYIFYLNWFSLSSSFLYVYKLCLSFDSYLWKMQRNRPLKWNLGWDCGRK